MRSIGALGRIVAACMLALLASPVLAQSARDGSAPAVAAASDLGFALEEIKDAYRREGHGDVRLTFGSSGNFARQIEQGAPFELFFSADEAYVERLVRAGLTRDEGVLYAVGRLALFAPHGSPVDPARGLDGLRPLLAAGELDRFAIANPEHAPYGRAAEQALRAAGLWVALEPRLLLGENVSQAAQFAASGNAAAGLVAYSLVLSPTLERRGRHALVPAEAHAPLRQRMVLTARASPAAERFYAFVQSPAARAIFARYGFVLPDG